MKSEEKKGPSRLISLQIPYDSLKQDLEDLRLKALDLGASMAEIIRAQWVEVDERVRLKCAIPLCPHYGTNIHRPPNGSEPELIRRALSRYRWAMHYGIDVIVWSPWSAGTSIPYTEVWTLKRYVER